MPKNFNSLRTRLTLVFIIVAVVPLLILAGLIAWLSFGAMRDQAITLQQSITRQLATEVGAYLNQRQNELQTLVDTRSIGNLDPTSQQELLAGLLANQSAYQELTLVDQNGQEQIRLSRSSMIADSDLVSRADSEAFLEPANSGEVYYSPVRFDETIREPLMTIAIPVIDLRSGQVSHILIAELRFNNIRELVRNFRKGENYAYIVDKQGNVVAHVDPSVVLRQTTFDLPFTDGGERTSGLSGSDVILAATPVEFDSQTLIAVAEQSYNEATRLAWNLVFWVGAFTLIALAVAVVAALVIVRQIVRPIEKLSAGVQAVQEGDLSQTVEVSSKDEIGQLAETFNGMTVQLRETIDNLEQSQATFRNIIASVPMGMYLYHLEPDNRLIFDGVNPTAQKMFAFASNELVNQPIEATFPGLAETELPARFREVATSGETWQTEFVYSQETEETVPLQDELDPTQNIYQVYAFQTSPDNIVAAFLDITESKQAEKERERLQEEVIEAQKQVIHELSTPVIPIMDNIIVMPLIGSIDTMRARDITRMLLAGITERQAKVVILDVTGMPFVDTGVVNHLNKTIQAAQLKGARTIVTGISEAVAETIVDLGIDWSNIETLSDLQTGLVAALSGLGVKLTNSK